MVEVCAVFFLFPFVARYQETIDVCICHMFVSFSVVVIVWGSVGMFVVQRPLFNIVFWDVMDVVFLFVL